MRIVKAESPFDPAPEPVEVEIINHSPKTALVAALDYDPITGSLLWKESGEWAVMYLSCTGRFVVRFKRKYYSAARVAWRMAHGTWPSQPVGMKDKNRGNYEKTNLYTMGPNYKRRQYSSTARIKAKLAKEAAGMFDPKDGSKPVSIQGAWSYYKGIRQRSDGVTYMILVGEHWSGHYTTLEAALGAQSMLGLRG